MRPHDRGGWPVEGPIDRSEHEWDDWEKITSGLAALLSAKGLSNTDQLRRGIESLDPATYESLSYFERWSASIETLLVEKNVLTTAEIDAKTKQLEERWG